MFTIVFLSQGFSFLKQYLLSDTSKIYHFKSSKLIYIHYLRTNQCSVLKCEKQKQECTRNIKLKWHNCLPKFFLNSSIMGSCKTNASLQHQLVSDFIFQEI